MFPATPEEGRKGKPWGLMWEAHPVHLEDHMAMPTSCEEVGDVF